MSEVGGGMRSKVVKALKPLDAQPIESLVGLGVPDVNYIGGWIELKWEREWPKRASTRVRIPHYTPEQRAWALRRRIKGGTVWFLLQCRREWLLYDAARAATLGVGRDLTREQLIQLADHKWLAGLNEGELITCVSQQQSAFSLTAEDAAIHNARWPRT